jgi:RHS repeat-associated protein
VLVIAGCSHDDAEGPRGLPEGSVLTLGPDDALLFYDGLGSLTEVARATGEALASTAFFPYGRTRYDSASETDKYTGVPRDSSVELDQMQARWYVPELGVWSSVDPLNWTDPTKKVGMPFAAGNPYAYAGCQPTTATDRSGECPMCIPIIIAAIASAWAADKEYDRQVKTGESNVLKVVGAGVIAAESTALDAHLPVYFGEGLAATMAAGGVRSASVSLASYGATSAITGERADLGSALKSAAWDFGGGMVGGMLSHAAAATALYPEGPGWQFGADAVGQVFATSLSAAKTVALPGPKASVTRIGPSLLSWQRPLLRAEPIARPGPAPANLDESNISSYVIGNLKSEGYPSP